MSVGAFSQESFNEQDTTMSEVIYRRVEKVLEEAGVLISKGVIRGFSRRSRRANEKMRESFRSEFVPLDEGYGNMKFKYKLQNWDLTYLGSTLFYDDKFEQPLSLKKPLLPIVKNNKQFIVHSVGKFNLFYSISEFTNMAVNANVEANAARFVHARFKSGYEYSARSRKTFSISSGLFENELARIFDECKNNTLSNKEEFLPLYLLWQLYANDRLDTNKDYYVLRDLNAIIWHRDNRSGFNSHTDIDAALKAGTSVIPFLKANINSKASWKLEKNQNSEFSLYDVYIMEEPTNLEKLPTSRDILKAWETFSDDYNNNEGINLQPHAENYIELTFGPASDVSQYGKISVDEEAFLSQFKDNSSKALITGVSIVGEPKPETNKVKVKVKFNYNPDYFSATGAGLNYFKEEKKLTLRMGDSIGSQFLSKTYNITFNAEATVVPKVSTENGLDPEAIEDNGAYTWKFNIDYTSLPSINSRILLYDILQKQIDFNHQFNEKLKSPAYLLKGSCIRSTNVTTRFNCEVQLNDPQDLLSPDETYLSAELTLRAIVSSNNLNRPYVRKIPILLRGVVPPEQITNDVVAIAEPAIIAEYFNSRVLIDGKTYEQIVNENSDESSKANYSLIGDLIIKEFNISRDQTSNKYLVPSDLINVAEYLEKYKLN